MTVTGKAERQPGAGIQMQVQEVKAAGLLPLITPFHHFCLCGVGCGVLENQPCKLLILLDVWWRWRVSNPRPPILCLKIYMLRLLYSINPSRPESQGVMGELF